MEGIDKAFDYFVNASQKTREAGDYEQDNILFCSYCNTPKQTIIKHPFTGKDTAVSCMCKCQQHALEESEKKAKREEQQRRREALRRSSFTDTDFARCTFDIDDKKEPELSKKMRKYAEHFETFREDGSGLILFGNVGTGKTFYSACIANTLIGQGYTVLMTSFPALISKLQRTAFDKNDYMDTLKKYDLLIIDDLGVESSSAYRQEHVYSVIDERYRARKPVIVSTNLTAEEMANPNDVMGDRIYSRLIERCLPVKFDGKNRRKSGDNHAKMRDIINS